jgi:integrase
MATRTRLTVKTIAAAEPGKMTWDAEIRGLGFRRDLAGADGTFYLNIKPKGTGKETRIKLGRLSTMTLEVARSEAAKLKNLATAGQDPSQQRASIRQKRAAGAVTVREGVERWLATVTPDLSPSTVKGYDHYMSKHVLPELGEKLVPELTRGMLVGRIDKAAETSRANAAALRRTISAFLTFADAREWSTVTLPRNKGKTGVGKAVAARKTVMDDTAIVGLWKAANVLEPLTAVCGKLVLLTGLRSGNAQGFRREWLVTENGKVHISIPAEHMKGQRPFSLQLTGFSQEVLQVMFDRSGLVFSKDGETDTTALSQAWPKWRKAAGIYEDARLHDVRRSLRTFAEKHGHHPLAAEAAIAHSTQKTDLDKAYQQHNYSAAADKVLLDWQNHVEKMVVSKTRKPKAVSKTTAIEAVKVVEASNG